MNATRVAAAISPACSERVQRFRYGHRKARPTASPIAKPQVWVLRPQHHVGVVAAHAEQQRRQVHRVDRGLGVVAGGAGVELDQPGPRTLAAERVGDHVHRREDREQRRQRPAALPPAPRPEHEERHHQQRLRLGQHGQRGEAPGELEAPIAERQEREQGEQGEHRVGLAPDGGVEQQGRVEREGERRDPGETLPARAQAREDQARDREVGEQRGQLEQCDEASPTASRRAARGSRGRPPTGRTCSRAGSRRSSRARRSAPDPRRRA